MGRPATDLTGRTVAGWRFVRPTAVRERGSVCWEVACEACGQTVPGVPAWAARREPTPLTFLTCPNRACRRFGPTAPAAAAAARRPQGRPPRDLTGKTVTGWTFVRPTARRAANLSVLWVVRCEACRLELSGAPVAWADRPSPLFLLKCPDGKCRRHGPMDRRTRRAMTHLVVLTPGATCLASSPGG